MKLIVLYIGMKYMKEKTKKHHIEFEIILL